MGNILDEIIETKRVEVAAAKVRRSLDEVRAAARDAAPPRDFYGAVARPSPRGVRLIA